MEQENIEKIKELISEVEDVLDNSGSFYMNHCPEDDQEGRRDWDGLHDDWSSCWYALENIKNQLKELIDKQSTKQTN